MDSKRKLSKEQIAQIRKIVQGEIERVTKGSKKKITKEKEKVELAEKLKRKIKELSSEIEDLHLGRKRIEESFEDLVRGIANRFRNCFGMQSGLLQLVLTEPGIKGPIKENLESVVKTIDDGIEYLEDFIKIAFLSLGVKTKCSIEALIDEKLSPYSCDLKNQEISCGLKNQGIEVVKNYSNSKPILVDVKNLGIAFLNIIKNALEAMPKGGTLKIEIGLKEKNVEIKFIDSGVGILDFQIRKIFQPFFTTKEKKKGLGLTIARRIVEFHEGEIVVKSEKDKGTEVTVILPIGSRET